jgi:chemotaxis protein methyltransferase CheR
MNLVTPEITDKEFNSFGSLIYERSGISLNQGKKELVRSRLLKRMRQCGISCFKEYYRKVMDDTSGVELIYLLDAISTNLTNFFREPQHFDYLSKELLPQWHKNLPGQKRFRFWSAGCSTGEEPYTLAIVLLEYLAASHAPWEIKISATDLSTRVLDQAQQGIYPEARAVNIPSAYLKRYFQKGVNQWAGQVRVKSEVRSLIEFFRVNLMEPFPFKEPVDVIFCRNVMIYFDKPTQERLVQKFHRALKSGGFLFIGHSESLAGISHSFSYVKPTIYKT